MIYYDPTESRKNSRLDGTIKKSGKSLDNLELYTGADLLLTHYKGKIDLPLLDSETLIDAAVLFGQGKTRFEISSACDLTVPQVLRIEHLWKACQMGLLIQRKSGMDYLSSIHKLDEIFGRMSLWSPDPVLLVAANIGCNRYGKAVVDGKSTQMPYHTVAAKKMSWQLMGGMVIDVPRDGLAHIPLAYLAKKIKLYDEDDTKYVARHTHSRVTVVGPQDTRWRWIQVLTDLPGIGDKIARGVADYAGSLANALVFLTDPEGGKYKDKPKGIGPKTIERIRGLMGLPDGVKLELTTTEDE